MCTEILYRDFKNFNERAFLEDVRLKKFSPKSDDSKKSYEFLSYQFQSVVNKYWPLKTKMFRGNNTPFVNKTLREEIYKRSAFLHKFLKDSSDSSWQKYRKQRNKCVKVGLLPSKNFYYYLLQRLFASVMKNAFYFILKALFVLNIFKFLS